MKRKVVFARHADTALVVAEPILATPFTQTQPGPITQTLSSGTQSQELVSTKKGILSQRKSLGGRPPKKQLDLPRGYKNLRSGISKFTPETADRFLNAYYNSGGSLTRACRDTGVQYSAALFWRDTIPEFTSALHEVDEIIKDEVHSQFMERVLTTWEPNPTWKLTYFKKHFPDYSEKKTSQKFVFNIKDSLIKPDIIDAEIIEPKAIGPGDEPGPQQHMEQPTDTA